MAISDPGAAPRHRASDRLHLDLAVGLVTIWLIPVGALVAAWFMA